MRNLLALVGLAVVGVGGVGWYMGWYTIKVAKSGDGTIQVQTNVDTNRAIKDVGDGARHVGELLGKQADQAKTDAATPPAPAATPAPEPQPEPNRRGGWLFGNRDSTTEPTGKR